MSRIPAIGQQRADGIAAGLQHPGDVIRLIAHALAVVGPIGGENMISHALAVDVNFIEAQRRHIEHRFRDGLLGGK